MSNSSQSRKRPQNTASILLSQQENEALFRLLGSKNYTLATGIVQLLAADPPSRREWIKKSVGVICFVKDYGEKSYFLRLYDISKREQIWEQAFYDGFNVKQKAEYNAPELVTFEGDNCVYGLNFSSVDEARLFANQINKHYEQEMRQSIKENRNSNSSMQNQSSFYPNQMTSQNIVAPPTMNFGGNMGSGGGKGKKKKNKPLTKDQIGLPTNFQHKVHVGWNPGEGFQTQTNAVSGEDLDPNIRLLLDKIGVTSTEKLSKKDRKMIYDVIDQYGGLEAVKHELSQQPPPPPSRSPPQVPQAPPSAGYPRGAGSQPKRDLPPPPQPVVSPNANSANARPLPPHPPPVPVITKTGAPPPPSAPPSGKSTAPPPPPPPPPMPNVSNAPPPPPPPPPPPSGPGAGAGRPNLLSEIEHGVVLKPVGSSETIHTSRSSDSRDGLLKDIKEGITLRPVDRQEKQRETPPEEMGGIAGALARALQDRRFKITDDTDTDDDDNDNDEDDEWDD